MAGGAEAADARHRLTIAPKGYADALIDLGIQANVSIVGVSACGPDGRTELSGRFTLGEALDRLLAGAPCRARIIDPRTVRIVAVVPPAPAPATHEPPRAPTLVSELVVTATKRPASLERLPAGVSAISREQVSTTGAVDAGSTIGQLAGVLSTNLGPGRDKLLIRGLSDGAFTGRARSTVSTYLDDAPINYNAPDPDLRLVDIERIEVVRGPQGALYGSGAIAGIYRIVTRKPDLQAVDAGILGGLAATKGGDASREIEGYVNLPLAPGVAALRISGYRDVQGGYLDDINLGRNNVDRTRRTGGRAALRVRFDEDWRFDVLYASQNLRSNDTQYVTLTTPTARTSFARAALEGGGPIMAPTLRANGVSEVHNNDFSHVAGTLEGDLGWAKVSSTTAFIHHKFSSQYDAPPAVVADLFGLARASQGVYVERARADMLVQDLVLRSAEPGRLTWLAGAYGARTIEHTPSELRLLPVGAGMATAYREDRKDRLGEIAAYGEITYEFSPGWTLSAGAREFESRVRTSSDIVVDNPGTSRSFENSRKYNGFLPKISLQREFATGDLVYALISEGFRPGGFNSSGFLAIRSTRVQFAPDRLRNYEVGAKLRALDGRLAIRTAAYFDDWQNIQTDQYRQSGLPLTANVGDARIFGLETELGYEWDFGLTLQVNALLSDSKVRNKNPDFATFTQPAQITDDLPGVPKASGGVLAIYQRPLTDGLTFRFVGEASYIGLAALSFDASLPSRMGHYLRARLSAELATDAWRAQVFVSNPLDSEGDTFAYGNPFSFGRVQQSTPQRPRTVGVRLARTF